MTLPGGAASTTLVTTLALPPIAKRPKITIPRYTLRHPKVGISDALAAGEQVAQRLRSLSDSIGPAYVQNQFYRRVRVKAQASIIEKVKRKQRGDVAGGTHRDPRPLYSFRDLTDLVGFRIVTLYDADLVTAINHIVDMVSVGSDEPQPLFSEDNMWNSFREAQFYQREAADSDVYVTCSKKLQTRIKEECGEKLQKRILGDINNLVPTQYEEQYSSAHLIFNAIAHFKDWQLEIPVEFQFRTAVEDIWAEINHRLLYKIRNPYVWNLDFEKGYRGALAASTALKKTTIAFPAQIAAFYQSSIDAQSGIASFVAPGVSTHFSLCMALFHTAGGSNLEAYEDDLQKYENILKRLPKNSGRTKALRFKGAMNVVRQLILTLRTEQQQLQRDTIDFKLAEQRVALCELELLRLEILIAVSCRFLLRGNDMIWVGRKSQREDWERGCAAVYRRLCEYRANPDPLVRPTAMVHYWKSWVSFIFDRRVARKNIENAYEELKFDVSLPPYSIYRIFIPRRLAAMIFEDASTSIDRFDKLRSDAKLMHGLSADLKADLVLAFGYALEAFKVSSIPNKRRGDIVFGSEPKEHVNDAQLILNIFTYFTKVFDTFITESNQIEIADIAAVLAHIKSQDLGALEPDDQKTIRALIADATALLKRVRKEQPKPVRVKS